MLLDTVSTACKDCPIRHKAVCATCDPDELAQLNAMKYYQSYSARQVIGVRGDPLKTVASVVSGVATLDRALKDGRTQMTGLLLPSDFIGRPGREVLQYDITAVTDVTLCCFYRKPFEKLLIEIPHLQERLLQMALDELDAAREWMLLLGRKTAREKIANLLVVIAKRAANPESKGLGDKQRIELPVNRETIANYLGLTIETVSRQFSALSKDGVIRLDSKRVVMIPDLEALICESGEDDDGDMII